LGERRFAEPSQPVVELIVGATQIARQKLCLSEIGVPCRDSGGGAWLARRVGDMRYFVAFLGLGVVLASAGLIQVLWLELAYILDGTFLPHDSFRRRKLEK
jgi:hypothetical protein